MEIDRGIATGAISRELTRRYGVSKDAILRHTQKCIPEFLETYRRERSHAKGVNVEREAQRLFNRLNKLMDACDLWLTDPEDAARYSLDARDSELTVVYRDLTDLDAAGRPKRKRAHLSDLLQRIEDSGRVKPVSATIKRSDPRELIVKTAAEIKGQIELFAKLQGLFQRDRANDADRAHDLEMIETVKAEVARLVETGWSEADARAIVMEAEPQAAQWLN